VTLAMREPGSGGQEQDRRDSVLADSMGRRARKLRIQVTDRCNYRCDFCMPEDPIWLRRAEVLTFEETARITGILADMGVETVRLSGGEPLVRRDVEKLVRLLADTPGIKSVSLTTNGSLLKEKAKPLKENGLNGVTVSIHSLRPERYGKLTGTSDVLPRVFEGLREARAVGLRPLKVNCVIMRGKNDDEIPDFVNFAHEQQVCVRFIEYMPFDGKRFWDVENVLSGGEIARRASEKFELIPKPREPGATASLFTFADGTRGAIGIIESMTKPFCRDCDRIRLTADGRIVPCLFSRNEFDVRRLLRNGATDEEVSSFIRKSFWLKSAGVESMIKQNVEFGRVRPMYTIGG